MVATEVSVAAGETWTRVKASLRDKLGDAIYSSWFASLELEKVNGPAVHLTTPTPFIRQWIQSHYIDTLLDIWQTEDDSISRIHLSARGALRPQPGNATVSAAVPPSPHEAAPAPHLASSGAARSGALPQRAPAPAPSAGGFEGSPLDQRFSFDTFEEGRANALALAAARQVAFAPEGAKISFNPLYIHGAVGFGKTHILQAIAAAALATDTGRRILYLTAEHFMYRFVAALRTKNAIAFKDVLREIDLLLIDDLQFLNGGKVQEEFCHTMNTLVDGARQVVIAADRPPVELDGLEARVRSRLSAGLLVELSGPDYVLRKKILLRRISAQKLQFPQLEFPPEVIDFIATQITTNGRDLDGAVNRLVAHNQLTGAAINVEMAEAALRDLLRSREAKRPKIEDIQRVVAQHFNVSRQDLVSARRTRVIVRPRQIAMYLAKSLTPRSLPEIGRRFGGRDHTTVLHAVRKVEELAHQDPQIAEDIETLKRLLDG